MAVQEAQDRIRVFSKGGMVLMGASHDSSFWYFFWSSTEIIFYSFYFSGYH